VTYPDPPDALPDKTYPLISAVEKGNIETRDEKALDAGADEHGAVSNAQPPPPGARACDADV